MALSETARLIASLELQDKFSKPAGNAEHALSRLQARANQFGKGIGQVSAGLGVAAVRIAAVGVALTGAAAGLVFTNIRAGIDSLRELQNVETQTNAVIASTKGVAGQTAASIRDLSEKFEDLNATMDDKVIQSAANVLLTFTNIRKDAFEPVLEAALNVNQALGGGPEGLQGVAIQLGVALNDPIRGLSRLRRIGVSFSKEQETQIKLLVEQNDLFGAQQLILKELGTEFGTSFAAAGTTAAAKAAKLRDKIEELQQTLAKPIVPVIDKITDRLIDLFDKPATAAAVSNLGNTIAGLFSDENFATATRAFEGFLAQLTPANFQKVGDGVRSVFGFLQAVPWATIGEGLRITGQAAKVAVDAFLSLPKEVQGIVISALAINKLSGGLISSGIGNIAGGLFGGGGLLGRGSSAANPVWVQGIGIGGPGGGGPVGALGRFGWLALLGPFVAAGITGGLIGAAAAEEFPAPFGGTKLRSQEGADAMRNNTEALEGNTAAIESWTPLGQFDPRNPGGTQTPAQLPSIVQKFLDKGLAGLFPTKLPNTAADAGGGVVVELPNTALAPMKETTTAVNRLAPILSRAQQTQDGWFSRLTSQTSQAVAGQRQVVTASQATAARVAEARSAIGRGFSELGGVVRSSKTNLRVTNNVTVSVAISDIQRRLTSSRVATGTISEF